MIVIPAALVGGALLLIGIGLVYGAQIRSNSRKRKRT